MPYFMPGTVFCEKEKGNYHTEVEKIVLIWYNLLMSDIKELLLYAAAAHIIALKG